MPERDEPVCNCTGPWTQTCHPSNPEGHQVGCPRWGIPGRAPWWGVTDANVR